MFLRDSGGDGPPVLLLHGWMFSADLNWYCTYDALEEAGYRVLAVDHRGHGRGIRTRRAVHAQGLRRRRRGAARPPEGPARAGGRLLDGRPDRVAARARPPAARRRPRARRHRDGLERPAHEGVLAHDGALRLALGLAPEKLWQRGLKAGGFPESPITTWVAAELSRGNSVDLAEAGRELGRYDSTRLDRRARRARRGHRHHRGHRRPARQAARARGRDERARASRSAATTAP